MKMEGTERDVVSNQRENEMACIALLVFYMQIKMIRIS